MDKIITSTDTDPSGSSKLLDAVVSLIPEANPTVYAVEVNGALLGPFATRPIRGFTVGEDVIVHEVAGFIHAWDRTRDWFTCPCCTSEVNHEDLVRSEDGYHVCDREIGDYESAQWPASSGELDPHGKPWATGAEVDAGIPATEWNPE